MPVMTQLEAETRGSGVRGPLCISFKFEASLGYMELFKKKKKVKNPNQKQMKTVLPYLEQADPKLSPLISASQPKHNKNIMNFSMNLRQPHTAKWGDGVLACQGGEKS